MSAPEYAMLGEVRWARPPRGNEGDQRLPRLTPYGEESVQLLTQPRCSVADEGSYYVATNPTPGTAIAHVVSAAVSETAGYVLAIRNGDAVNGLRIYLDYLRLICTTAPAAATRGDFFLKIGPAALWASGGSPIIPVSVTSDKGAASIAMVKFGALTTVADPNARLVARGMLRAVIPVVGDEWIFKFDGLDAGAGSLGGSVPLRMPIACPPVILGPGHSLGLQVWYPSNAVTPAEYEFELGWWER